MITGTVLGAKYPVIDVIVLGPGGAETVDAIVDSGFTDELTLPSDVIQRLQLPFDMATHATLADGSTVIMDCFRGQVLWDGGLRDIQITRSEGTPLVGMALFHGYDLAIEVIDGGMVRIEKH